MTTALTKSGFFFECLLTNAGETCGMFNIKHPFKCFLEKEIANKSVFGNQYSFGFLLTKWCFEAAPLASKMELKMHNNRGSLYQVEPTTEYKPLSENVEATAISINMSKV